MVFIWRKGGQRRAIIHQQRFGNIIFIPGPGNGKYPFCNSLYIDDDVKGIVDPASNEQVLSRLAAGNEIDILLNTHYHEDHFTWNHLFSGAALYVHKEDAPCFASLNNLMQAYGIVDEGEKQIWRQLLEDVYNYRERKPDRLLEDGDVLDFGSTRLEVLHTPGHTPGHISLYCEAQGLLFTGDLDMTAFGPWYGDAVSDIGQTIASIHRLMTVPARTVITAHQMGILKEDLATLARAYLDVIDAREKKIVDFLKAPRTLEEIADQWFIYRKPREPEMFYRFGERGMVAKHLEYLIQNGRAAVENGRYYLT